MEKQKNFFAVFNSILLVLILFCCLFICYELVQLNDLLETFKYNFDSLASFLKNQ